MPRVGHTDFLESRPSFRPARAAAAISVALPAGAFLLIQAFAATSPMEASYSQQISTGSWILTDFLARVLPILAILSVAAMLGIGLWLVVRHRNAIAHQIMYPKHKNKGQSSNHA